MHSYRIFPTKLKGHFGIPPSKSHTMRALIFAAKATTPSKITNYLKSPDTYSMITALRILGTHIDILDNTLHITPHPWTTPSYPIDAGNSGQVYRFIKALSPTVQITGDESIQKRRPITPLLEGLKQLPNACIDGADSQPVSGLLMAMAFLDHPSTLRVINPGEKPWVAMTLSWFDFLGISYTNDQFENYRLPGFASYPGFDYTVPPDASSAAYPWAYNLINFGLVFDQPHDPTQGDHKLFEQNPQGGGIIDVNPFIDALPILAILGCFAKKPLTLKNGALARKKESDRIAAMTCELTKMGANIIEHPDGMTIHPSPLHGADLLSHNDHRIAMSLIIAGLNASSPSIIDTACIQKSYPNFIQELEKCSSSMALQPLEKRPLANI